MMDKNKRFDLSKFDSVEAVTNQAQDSFDRMKLSDAEHLYLRLIHHLKETENNERSLICCYEGLAEVYLKHSSRLHIINKLEWQWLHVQAIVLLQHAREKCVEQMNNQLDDDDCTWYKDKEKGICSKLNHFEERLVNSLQECTLYEGKSIALTMLHRGGCGDDMPQCSSWVEKLQTYCKNRLKYGLVNLEKPVQINLQAVTPPPQRISSPKLKFKAAEYRRDEYNRIRNKFLFHSRIATKYGLQHLDKSRRCVSLNCLDSLDTLPEFPNQNGSAGAKRPQSLDIKPVVRPTPIEQVKKAVEYLKTKAEQLRRRHSIASPAKSWRHIVEQHNEILNKTLDDFKVDYKFETSESDEYDNYSMSDSGIEGDHEWTRVSRSHFYDSSVCTTIRTREDNLMVYNEDTIIAHNDDTVDTGYCRDNVINPLPEETSKSSTGDNSSQDQPQSYVLEESTIYAEEIQAFGPASLKELIDHGNNNKIMKLPNSFHSLPRLSESEDLQGEVTVELNSSSSNPGGCLTRRERYYNSNALPIDELSPHETKTYRLHTFEEFSPVTETCSLHFDKRRDLISSSIEENVPTKSMVLPINERKILTTLAHSVLKMANKQFEKEDLERAAGTYEHALGLFHTSYKGSGFLDCKIAEIFRKLGIIRTRNGDIIGGIGLMEQAMRMLQVFHETDIHIQIAEIWYEMGNAYIIEHRHRETLRDHVILTLREQMNSEFLDYFIESDEEFGSNDGIDHYELKNSYSVSAYEALTCYQHTYSILKELANHRRRHTDMMAKVLTKLGDCSVVIDNYDEAVNYYEEALHWFPNARERTSLPANAHVLLMLGVVRFLLKRYSKAAAIFQCANLIYQHMRVEDTVHFKFETAYILALLSFAHYATKQYFKSTSFAFRAIEIFTDLYQDMVPVLSEGTFWFINQTIYTLGYAYLSVGMFDRALSFLQLARNYSHCSQTEDKVQTVLILKAIGDCYDCMDCHQTALGFYCEALAVNEANGKNGQRSSTLQNQLLSKTAGMHVSMQQYSEAAVRLDQARDMQIDMQDYIQGDLVSLLHQLGQTHTLACDVDKAMECYEECIEAYEEVHDLFGPEMSATYGNLATLCHVKACMTDDTSDAEELLVKAEEYYLIALELESSAILSLKYANFLFHQESYSETVQTIQQLLGPAEVTGEVIFSGIEQVVAPELLQIETEDEEIIIPSVIFAKYLLIVSYKYLNQLNYAEYYIIDLMDDLYNTHKPIVASVLGYALFQLSIFDEAGHFFRLAMQLSKDDNSPLVYMWCLCTCLELYKVLQNGLRNIFEYYDGPLTLK